MTTFQYIIDAILNALTHLIPLADSVPRDLYQTVLHWGATTAELQLLVTLVGSLVFLIFFRFDWLGLFSALIKSIVQPKSLKSEVRTLDQQSILFLLIVCVPSFFAQRVLLPFFRDNEWATHPFVMSGVFLAVAATFQFAAGWNKRIKGLNHLRLADAITIALLTCLSAHPAVSIVFALWVGFAFGNYHYEAIFKYSMLILGIETFAHFFALLQETSISQSLESVGHLNAVAVLVLAFTTFWVTLEQLQKTLSEHTLKAFKWVSILCAVFYVAVYFLRG
jgi:undecaprenyl pyrophosphate phosphatase UppP